MVKNLDFILRAEESLSRYFSKGGGKPDLFFWKHDSVCPDDGLGERDSRNQEELGKTKFF